jgi:hypothetical protein
MQEMKQKIQAMADRCRDLGKTNRKDEKEYEEKKAVVAERLKYLATL